MAPFVTAATKSPVVLGVIVPLAVRSLRTNQLPGGSTLRMPGDLPSEMSGPLGLTPAGPEEPEAFLVGESLPLPAPDADDAAPDVVLVLVHGHCAACWGAMQLVTAIAAITIMASLFIVWLPRLVPFARTSFGVTRL